MRRLLLAVLGGCGAPPEVEPSDGGPCAEAWNRLEADDRSYWGTGGTGLKIAAGGAFRARRSDGGEVTGGLSWPAGPVWMVWAERADLVDPLPPLTCEDRVEMPARLTLQGPEGGMEVVGVYRAVGPYATLQSGFVGRSPVVLGWGTPPVGDELAVWARWEGTAFSGEIRAVSPDAEDHEAGEPLLTWGP